MTTYAGAPMKRFEDPQLLQGQGSFVDDKVLPNMVHAAVLRSPHAYAIIRSIDTSKAKALEGVVDVITSDDIPGLETIPPRQTERLENMKSPRHPVLAIGKVAYVGQAVAVVIAESRYIARDALELIEVDYEPRRPVMDPYEALSPDSTPIHEDLGTNVAVRMEVGRGDVDAALAQSHKVIRERFHVPRLAPNPMEGRGLIADYQPANKNLDLWTSTQVPHKPRASSALSSNGTTSMSASLPPTWAAASARKSNYGPKKSSSPTWPFNSNAPSSGLKTDGRTSLPTKPAATTATLKLA